MAERVRGETPFTGGEGLVPVGTPKYPSPLAGEGFLPRSSTRSRGSRMAERVRGEMPFNIIEVTELLVLALS